jgi:hypothetical protein
MKKIIWALFFLVVFSSTVYAADPPKFGVGVREAQRLPPLVLV